MSVFVNRRRFEEWLDKAISANTTMYDTRKELLKQLDATKDSKSAEFVSVHDYLRIRNYLKMRSDQLKDADAAELDFTERLERLYTRFQEGDDGDDDDGDVAGRHERKDDSPGDSPKTKDKKDKI
jgi:hypothetical protein